MADKYVRIGSMEDIHIYDDGDYDAAVETDAPIKAGTPAAGNDVLRLDDIIPYVYTLPYATKNADYTLTTADYIILVDTSGGDVTITLPTAVGVSGRVYEIKNIDDTNLCDVATTGIEEIDGDASNFVLLLHESIHVISDGANWWII